VSEGYIENVNHRIIQDGHNSHKVLLFVCVLIDYAITSLWAYWLNNVGKMLVLMLQPIIDKTIVITKVIEYQAGLIITHCNIKKRC
jgi:hypothetical protein